jgi:hypothetical protein
MRNEDYKPSKQSVKLAKKRVVVRKKPELPASLTSTGRKRKSTMSPERRAEIRTRQQSALELRMAGMSYREIAESLGYANPASAKYACDKAISRTQIDAAKEVVAMDLARLDEFQMRCTHALRTNGDLGQIDRILRIMDWRYRLLGVTEETVRSLQAEHGIHTTIHNKNNVQIIMARPDTEHEYIQKMMKAVGVEPDSEEAKSLLRQYNLNKDEPRELPMLEGSANSDSDKMRGATQLEHEDIVDAEIVE